MAYQGTFKRYEKKYFLTKEQYQCLTHELSCYMQPDEYGKHTISNLYYDTDHYDLISRSLQKPVYKEKLRLRSYGVPKKDSMTFLELKKKYQGIVYKRRVPMKYGEAIAYLKGKESPLSGQIVREIDWFLDFYKPTAKAMIAYERIALFGKENSDLRVTFDTEIRCRNDYLDLTKGTQGTSIIPNDHYLMEIKVPGTMPMWMSHMLSEYSIFPKSFSKYGEYYKQVLIYEEEGGIINAG